MRISRRSAAMLSAGIAMSTFAGCGSGDSGSSSAGGTGTSAGSKVIKLGGFGAQTGSNSVIFPISQATEACFKQTNADGGINGYTFDYTVIDDQYDPSLTVNAVRKLVQEDNVLAVVGGLGTATNLGAQGYLEAQGVPNVAPGTGSPAVANDKTFMTWQNYAVDAAYQAQYAIKDLQAKKLGILYQNDDFGAPFKAGAEYAAKQLGATVEAVPFGLDEQDFTPVVSKLKSAGVDAAIIAGSPKNFPLIIKSAESINYRPKWIGANFFAVPSVLRELPDAQTSNMTFSSWHPLADNPDVSDMVKGMKQYFPNVEPSPYTVEGWLGCTVFNEAFRKMTAGGKEPSREGMIDALNGLSDFSNAYVKNLSYADGSHTVALDEFPFVWSDGKLKEIGPFEPAPEVPESVWKSS